MNKRIYNFLTFDIEEWYHANYDSVDFSKYVWNQTNLESNVDRLIDLCFKKKVKSTCFVLGKVAEKKPGIVKKLHHVGFEIASHGYSHELVYNMIPPEFEDDLKKSCDILENITGEKVLGFRAPSWSVKKENLNWYYSILDKLGLKYSSSVYPAKTFLYGISGFPEKIHYPVINGKKVNILEIPVPVINIIGKKIGFSGGFYFRFFPTWVIKSSIAKKNSEGKSVFIYLHPREIDPNQPKLKLPILENFIHYWGIKGCEKKMGKIIKLFSNTFILMRDCLKENSDCEN